MTAANSTKTIACDLNVFSKDQRAAHVEQSRRLMAACTGMRELPRGLDLFFADSVLESDLEAWRENESRCCAFAEYEPGRDDTGLRLFVRTDSEGKRYLMNQYKTMGGIFAAEKKPSGLAFVVAAAALCLVCLLPVVGAFLVARGVISSFWNPGELLWIGIGLVLSGGWIALTKWKRRRSQAASCGC